MRPWRQTFCCFRLDSNSAHITKSNNDTDWGRFFFRGFYHGKRTVPDATSEYNRLLFKQKIRMWNMGCRIVDETADGERGISSLWDQKVEHAVR